MFIFPVSDLRRDDFPAPTFPTIATNYPGTASKLMLCTEGVMHPGHEKLVFLTCIPGVFPSSIY